MSEEFETEFKHGASLGRLVADEKTEETTKQILKKEGVKYSTLFKVDDWLLDPKTVEWVNGNTGEFGRGVYEFIKKVRFSK